ncbi:hypothetical protein PInf_010930 [Phytophthora infestans]|nr:hypothetical protein PInf_010930 [Phytophthora infestans]
MVRTDRALINKAQEICLVGERVLCRYDISVEHFFNLASITSFSIKAPTTFIFDLAGQKNYEDYMFDADEESSASGSSVGSEAVLDGVANA